MSWRLVTSDGQSFRIHRSAIAGRSSSVHIVLNDTQVSRRHAELRAEGNTLMVRDLGSRNGTYVNGVRLTAPHTLRPGDWLRIGNTSFQVQWVNDQVVVPSAPVPPPAAQPAAVSHQPIKYVYCSNCMSRIAENAEVCPQCGAPQGVAAAPRQLSKIAYCSNCGAQIAEGALLCPQCGASQEEHAVAARAPVHQHNPNTAFLIELVGGLFGFLGLGHIYAGRTGDGVLRLVLWLLYSWAAWIAIALLSAILVGLVCIPVQAIIQIAVPIWSATTIKNQLLHDF